MKKNRTDSNGEIFGTNDCPLVDADWVIIRLFKEQKVDVTFPNYDVFSKWCCVISIIQAARREEERKMFIFTSPCNTEQESSA